MGWLLGGLIGLGLFVVARNLGTIKHFRLPPFGRNEIPTDVAIGLVSLVIAEIQWSNSILSLSSFVAGFLLSQLITPYRRQQAYKSDHFRESLQLPELVDLLSISLTAGVSLSNSFLQTLPRVSKLLQSFWEPLSDESIELTFLTRLELVARLNPDSSSGLLANQLLVSVERGTAMLPVLEAFAADLRSRNQRALLERAAKKDVWMMVPVVFGILPAVTVVAIYPAMISLSNI